mgnify:CR=1 FL=1
MKCMLNRNKEQKTDRIEHMRDGEGYEESCET